MKWLLSVSILVFVALAVLVLRPVPALTEANARTITGTVSKVAETGTKDVSLWLDGETDHFYINRGLERGLDLLALQAALVQQEVTLVYPDHWTPLDPGRTTHHVSQLIVQDSIWYSE